MEIGLNTFILFHLVFDKILKHLCFGYCVNRSCDVHFEIDLGRGGTNSKIK